MKLGGGGEICFTFLIGDVGVTWPVVTEGVVTAMGAVCTLIVFELFVAGLFLSENKQFNIYRS